MGWVIIYTRNERGGNEEGRRLMHGGIVYYGIYTGKTWNRDRQRGKGVGGTLCSLHVAQGPVVVEEGGEGSG